MSKKNQVYLSAFLMYLVAGFAGYLINISSYWMVLVISLLISGYTMLNVFSKEENLMKDMMIEWISVCAFLGLELIITVCVCMLKVPYSGFFKYFNYAIQILGLLAAMYAIVKFVISNTTYYNTIKSKFKKKECNDIVAYIDQGEVVNNDIQENIQVEQSQEVNQENIVDENISTENINKNEVFEIECKKEEQVVTPYMEEEI